MNLRTDQLTSEWVQTAISTQTVSHAYSANGCLTNISPSVQSAESVDYAFDYDNRLTSASSALSAVEYLYDAAGARIGRIAGGSPATTNYFVIDYADGLKRPLAETDASGTVTRYYVWSGSQLLCHIEANGDIFYYHADELGSTLALTDKNGVVTDEFAYMPYGYANHTPHAGSSDTPFQWLGGYGVYYDSTTDLHLTLHRAYSSKLKRFIHPDPLGIDGGVNVYAMANLNPLWFVDPYGLESITPGTRAGEKLRGAVNRGVEFTQNALESIGNGVWSGVSYVGDGFDYVANQLSDFQWHGFWGGPNWTARQPKSELALTEQDKRVEWTDARDSAYKQHDIDIFDAQNHSPFHDMRLGWNLLQVPPWQRSFWMTDRGVPIPAYVESLLWFTGLPGVVQ